MPCSGCLALHGVNPVFFKYYHWQAQGKFNFFKIKSATPKNFFKNSIENKKKIGEENLTKSTGCLIVCLDAWQDHKCVFAACLNAYYYKT